MNNSLVGQNLSSLLRHYLDRFCCTGNYLYFADMMMLGNDISLKTVCFEEASLSNDVLVKFVKMAVDSCCVIQNQLKCETKPGCARELISVMSQILLIIRALILILMKRNDSNTNLGHINSPNFKKEFKSSIAWILVEELVNRCPTVSAPLYGYYSPAANTLFNIVYIPFLFLLLKVHCPVVNYQFMMMIIQARCDLNATDSQGNTLLHNVIRDILHEIDALLKHRRKNKPIIANGALEIVKMLLEKGSYPHAKNKEGKCPFDELVNSQPYQLIPEEIFVKFSEIKMKYDCTLTLKYLAATKIVYCKIPYKDLLPEALVKFVDLH